MNNLNYDDHSNKIEEHPTLIKFAKASARRMRRRMRKRMIDEQQNKNSTTSTSTLNESQKEEKQKRRKIQMNELEFIRQSTSLLCLAKKFQEKQLNNSIDIYNDSTLKEITERIETIGICLENNNRMEEYLLNEMSDDDN